MVIVCLFNFLGLRTYRRPEGKSGGHGVGWSPIIPYSFKVPDEWEEVSHAYTLFGDTVW